MRLFAALDISPDHKRLLSSLRRTLPGVIWYPPESYHLTLRFIGEIRSRPVLEDIDYALTGVVSPSFTLEPQGVGIGHSSVRPRLWAGIAPSPALTALQARIETALRRAGLPAEKRRFQAHISLAALSGEPGPETIRWIQAHNLLHGKPVPTEHFTLFRSYRTTDLPHYEACADYAFTPHRILSDFARP